MRVLLCSFALAAGLMASAEARGQNHDLHMAQADALMDYAVVEARMAFSVVAARVYDGALAQAAISELSRALRDAKRSLDRTDALLPEAASRYSDRILKVRNQVVEAEAQLARFKQLLESETASLSAEEEEADEDDEAGEDGEAETTDWNALKVSAMWLHGDVRQAKAGTAGLAKALGARFKMPPAPRGKHPE